jgi:GntR family transcriptional regulator
MLVRVHAASGVPLYLQIETQIKQAVAAQALLQDTPLPPVRKLAAELRVNTVARAYQNLERDGVIRTVPGGGCYVNSQTPRLLKSEKLRRLKPMAAQLAVEATQVVLSREDTVRLVEDAFDELPSAAPTNSRKDRS